MGPRYRTALFVFRRDLRLRDNTGLMAALEAAAEVVPAFVLDPRQTGPRACRSGNALQVMVASLAELDRELRRRGSRLRVFEGEAEAVVARIVRAERIDAVYVNRDSTPFSRARDQAVARACREGGASFVPCADIPLNEPEAVVKADGHPYTIFTPYFRAARALGARPTRDNRSRNYRAGGRAIAGETDADAAFARVLPRRNEAIFRQGGRAEALALLKKIGRLADYDRTRNLPALDGTTGLSPHLTFGTVSVREVHDAVRRRLGPGHALLRQLYWRDFFIQVAFHFERVFGRPFRAEYERLAWSDDRTKLRRWQEGSTGFPFVDAGMRQLNETGFMHNRARMVCASFLVKDLHIDWREGERYFAARLEDYDPSVNNGNWQWVASTGCDAQPFFRVFNPWLQQKRYDPEAVYIKRWVPELRRAAPEVIHRLDRPACRPPGGYPAPLVDHAVESARAFSLYRQARNGAGRAAAQEKPPAPGRKSSRST